MKRTINKTMLLLGGVLTFLIIANCFPLVQSVKDPGSEENVDNLNTRITNIEISLPSEAFIENLEGWSFNFSGSMLFQLSLEYRLWNTGRKIAAFTTSNWYDLRDIIPLECTWDTLHSGEIDFHRNLLIAIHPMVKTYEFPPGITNGTARFYLSVKEWTSDTLPFGNYTFNVGKATWGEHLPATLHVENNQTWTETADLPEGWGIDASISGYPPKFLGVGVVGIAGFWGWTRKRRLD